MTFPLLGLALLLVGGVLAFVLWPLQGLRMRMSSTALAGEQRSDVWESGSEPLPARAALLARREALYAALRDAEFDYAVGKLAMEDYQALRRRLTFEAAQVLRQLDHLTPELSAVYDEEIERAVARLRAGDATVITSLPLEIREAVEAGITSLIKHSAGSDKPDERTCLHCGHVYQPGDLFCIYCGTKLEQGGDRNTT
ncbi:MAG: zinc ribbon domain-containing protein [Anaerolineae bacterium]